MLLASYVSCKRYLGIYTAFAYGHHPAPHESFALQSRDLSSSAPDRCSVSVPVRVIAREQSAPGELILQPSF